MLRLLSARIAGGNRTTAFPEEQVELPPRFRGRPIIDARSCDGESCRACADSCPTNAIGTDPLSIDLGACLFCTVCQDACPTGALALSRDHRLAARSREDLVVTGSAAPDDVRRRALSLDRATRRLFGRSLKLRQVSAGGCSGCEAELVALGNVVFDLSRFGIQFVASPRHADGLVITGPVTANMRDALLATYEATPTPRIVIAVGACAISGGPFAGADAVGDGVPQAIPVDLYVPGCPPHPFTIIDGLLGLLGRLEDPSAPR